MFTKKLGIDLGTTNTLVFVPHKGIVCNEPSIVAVDLPTKKIIAVGKVAKKMLGKTPGEIEVRKPLKDGVIAEYYVTQAMLKYFISKALPFWNFTKPDVIISVPAGITSTEKRAVIKAALESGAKNAFVVKEPILAALGAGVPINSPSGNMIVNIGGGTSEIAIISLGGIVSFASVRVAGNKFDQAIADYIKKKYNLAIGEQSAEKIKIEIGAALPEPEVEKKEMKVKGRDLISGMPRSIIIDSNEVAEALFPQLQEIAGAIKQVFLKSPPELIADIMERGIILTGGGALLRGMARFIEKIVGVPVYPADSPLFCVAKGTGIILEHLDLYKRTVFSKK
ncbi:rod shape-determining protein [bacterium]|nr:rod shape-determining protein [bacterium]